MPYWFCNFERKRRMLSKTLSGKWNNTIVANNWRKVLQSFRNENENFTCEKKKTTFSLLYVDRIVFRLSLWNDYIVSREAKWWRPWPTFPVFPPTGGNHHWRVVVKCNRRKRHRRAWHFPILFSFFKETEIERGRFTPTLSLTSSVQYRSQIGTTPDQRKKRQSFVFE